MENPTVKPKVNDAWERATGQLPPEPAKPYEPTLVDGVIKASVNVVIAVVAAARFSRNRGDAAEGNPIYRGNK